MNLKRVLVMMGITIGLAACHDAGSKPARRPHPRQVMLGSRPGDFSAPEFDGTRSKTVPGKVIKTDEEWRKILTPEEYRITRERGTERAFTGKYWKTKTPGVYQCVGCGQDLFDSDTKYESGTGWPSFWKAVAEENIGTETDSSHGVVRTEVHCSRCRAHLGHIFSDGPPPTGLRYCINSPALKLVEREEEKK